MIDTGKVSRVAVKEENKDFFFESSPFIEKVENKVN